MRIPRVFYDGPLEAGNSLSLNKEQLHYLGNVLRLKAERQLILFNGQGGEYLCEISELDRRQGLIKVLSFQDTNVESTPDICLALALSKGDRFDWAIQKATELGVTRVLPLFSARSEVRLTGQRLEKKLDHWRGVLRSASEQSGRTRIPDLAAPQPFSECVSEDKAACKLLLDPRAEVSLAGQERRICNVPDICLLVGPEGGFDDQEIALAHKHDYLCTHMGPRVLRTETAPIAALAFIQAVTGNWDRA